VSLGCSPLSLGSMDKPMAAMTATIMIEAMSFSFDKTIKGGWVHLKKYWIKGSEAPVGSLAQLEGPYVQLYELWPEAALDGVHHHIFPIGEDTTGR
jgi:hypothetical protein